MNTRIPIIILKYGIGLELVAWMVLANWHIMARDGQEVGVAAVLERTIDWVPLAVAFLVGLIAILITIGRWYVLVRALDLPFSMYNAVRLGLFGFFASTFLPGSVTGDIPKAYFLARGQNRRTAAVATVIMDRVLGLCALVYLVAGIGVCFWGTGQLDELAKTSRAKDLLQFIVGVSLTLWAGSLIFWVLLGFVAEARAERIALQLERFPRIGGSLAELWRSVVMYRTRGRSVALAIAMAMFGHLGFVTMFFLCSHTINATEDVPSLGTHFLIVPVGMTIQAGVPTPGGIGGGEFAFSWLYLQVGAGARGGQTRALEVSPEGILAALTNRIVFWILSFIGYLVWARMRDESEPVTITLASDTAPANSESGSRPVTPPALHPDLPSAPAP